MARNTKERALVWVKIAPAFADIKYGFRSGADAGDRGALGQEIVTLGVVTPGLIIGCNNIKPGKATKVKATGSESSFYSHDKKAALRTAKWTCGDPKIRTRRSTNRSTAYYVTINGVKYGWLSAKGIESVDIKGLGLVSVKPTDVDVFYGCSMPKPPTVRTVLPSGSSYSTFIDPSKTVPAEWTTGKSGKTTP